MKKCASCTKDLPDAALHCVFCGTKQPPAPAVQQGMAKTAFGYSANEVAEAARQAGPPRSPGGPGYPPPGGPAFPPPRPAPSTSPPPNQNSPLAYAATMAPPPSPPAYAPTMAQAPAPSMPPGPPRGAPPTAPPPMAMAPMPMPPPRQAPSTAPPPMAPAYPPAQPSGNFVPVASAAAPTMFVNVGGPGQPQPPQPQQGYAGSPSAMQATLVPPPIQPQPMAMPMSPQPMQMRTAPAPMPIPAAQPPPYLASQTGSKVGRPFDPWQASLRGLMFLWGLALLAAFATPLQTSPSLAFQWTTILDGAGLARLPPLLVASIGLLSVLLAPIPMPTAARGAIAALLGLAGVVVPIVVVGAVPGWQQLAPMAGVIVLVPGLIVRNEYRHALMPRILVTLGALAVLAPVLVPQGGAIPLVSVFKALIDAPGSAKVAPALVLGEITIVVMSLLAWLPAPVTGAAKLWAWLLILWALITHVAALVLAGNLGDAVTGAPNATFTAWVVGGPGLIGSAYLVLIGYGLAALFGKQLE